MGGKELAVRLRRTPSSAGVDDVRRQGSPIAGEDEPEEAGNADRVGPSSVRDREKSNACNEESNREPCFQLVAHEHSVPGSDRGLARPLLAATELTTQCQPEEERKRG